MVNIIGHLKTMEKPAALIFKVHVKESVVILCIEICDKITMKKITAFFKKATSVEETVPLAWRDPAKPPPKKRARGRPRKNPDPPITPTPPPHQPAAATTESPQTATSTSSLPAASAPPQPATAPNPPQPASNTSLSLQQQQQTALLSLQSTLFSLQPPPHHILLHLLQTTPLCLQPLILLSLLQHPTLLSLHPPHLLSQQQPLHTTLLSLQPPPLQLLPTLHLQLLSVASTPSTPRKRKKLLLQRLRSMASDQLQKSTRSSPLLFKAGCRKTSAVSAPPRATSLVVVGGLHME